VEEKRPGEALAVFETGKQTIFLGSTDLCLIRHIPDLVQGQLKALKIEGRMKSAYHVSGATRIYRAALDAYAADPSCYHLDPLWLEELDALSHRPYAEGFASGYPTAAPESLQTFNHPVSSCEVVGYVLGHDANGTLIEVKYPFARGETLQWLGPRMAGGHITVPAIFSEGGEALLRTVSATRVYLRLEGGEPLGLLPWSILRRKRQMAKFPGAAP
jgi:putative protease